MIFDGRKLYANAALAVIALVFIMNINCASGLGVTPAIRTFAFEPGKDVSGSFSIVNTGHEEMNLRVYADGDLKNYIKIETNSLKFGSGDDSNNIKYSMIIPKELGPGPHSANIVIVQPLGNSGGEGALIGAAVSVVAKVLIEVPYPGKYLETGLDIRGAGEGQDVIFAIPIVSKGKEDIEKVKANIDIYDNSSSKVGALSSDEMGIRSLERKEIVKTWAADVPKGNYKALIALNFDGNIINLEGTFSVGEIEVELIDIRVRSYQLGGIAKFEMVVQNKWGEQIRQIYSQTDIYNVSSGVQSFKSSTESVGSFGNKTLVSYWDSAGVQKGEYYAAVNLNYDGKSSKKDLMFNVKDDRIEITGLGYVISEGNTVAATEKIFFTLAIVIGLLILTNLVWFFKLRKKMREKS